jgi:AraC-like DNA-binding protein
MLFIFGIGIAFFLAFILLSKKNKTLADKILAIWLVVIGMHIGLFYTFMSGLYLQYPHIIGFHIPFPLLHGPLLFLYTVAMTNPNYFHNKRWLLHFALPAALFAYLVPFIAFSSVAEKIDVAKNKMADYQVFMIVNAAIFICSGFGYVIWINILLRKHKRNITSQFSNIERINLQWLQYLMYLLGITWLFVAWGNDYLIFSASSLFVFFIAYFGIKQVGIFTNSSAFDTAQNDFNDKNENTQLADNEENTKKKYQKSGLSDEQAEKLQQDLTQLMLSEKCYINPELTLSDLATRLGVPSNYLSQVINEKEGVSFYDYVNTLRIEEFKKQIALPENKNYTLLSVAYDCGFNSKSSFNRHFKKVTNLSPSEYVRQED